MSELYTEAVWRHSKNTGPRLLLLLAIARKADDSGIACPGIQYLARATRRTRNAVQKTLADIASSGELAIHRNEGIQTPKGKTNLYRILLPIEESAELWGIKKIIPHTGKSDISIPQTVHKHSTTVLDGVEGIIPNEEDDDDDNKTEGVEGFIPLDKDVEAFRDHFLKLKHAFTTKESQGAITLALSKYGLEKTVDAYETAISVGAENVCRYSAAILKNGSNGHAPRRNPTRDRRRRAKAGKQALAPDMRFAFNPISGKYMDMETGKEITSDEYAKYQ